MSQSVYYRLGEGLPQKVGEEDFLAGGANFCYLTPDKLREHRERLGIDPSALEELPNGPGSFRNSLDVYDGVSLGFINIINVGDVEGEMDRVMFILKPGLLCLVEIQDGDGSELKLVESILAQEKPGGGVHRVFIRFLERQLRGGNRMLERFEEKLLALEDQVVHHRADERLNRTIYAYRHQLALIRNYYEQLVDIGSELEENENGLLGERETGLFRVFTAKAERLVQGVRAQSENLMHLRETLDATLNYNLNVVMKMFTMVTTVFLPLTLIVGWYGMNFKHMPELEWRFGYPLVLVTCVLIVGFILFYFKKKKLM